MNPVTEKWVHYTDHEMITINTKSFHNDPAGIYFFPEDHYPHASMWHQKKYRFVITLKPTTDVLYLPTLSDDEIETLVTKGDVKEAFEAYIGRYPPESHEKKIRMAWEQLRNQYKFAGRWNAILRGMGYDAVFDDAGIIHSSEPIQLLLLNPRAIASIIREQPKPNLYQKMNQVVTELVDICYDFGEVSVQRPRRQKDTWSSQKQLRARVEVKRSEDNYASFNITISENGKNIGVHLSWSNPKLNYGVGATFEIAPNRWQFDGLKSVKRDLHQIFK